MKDDDDLGKRQSDPTCRGASVPSARVPSSAARAAGAESTADLDSFMDEGWGSSSPSALRQPRKGRARARRLSAAGGRRPSRGRQVPDRKAAKAYRAGDIQTPCHPATDPDPERTGFVPARTPPPGPGRGLSGGSAPESAVRIGFAPTPSAGGTRTSPGSGLADCCEIARPRGGGGARESGLSWRCRRGR